MGVLNSRIKREWHPPKKSESVHIKVRFAINRQGELSNLFLAESSHDEKADQAALEAVKSAAPFMPLPDSSPESVEIEFSFNYNVNKDPQKHSAGLALSEDPARRAKGLAFRYLLFGSYAIALESFDKAVALNRLDPECWVGRADAYCHLKQYDKALNDCHHAFKLDPQLKTIYLVQARCYSALNQHFRALDAINQAVKKDSNAKTLLQRANIYSNLGQYGRAVDDLTAAIKINYWSKDSEALIDYNARGDAYARLGLFGKAIDDYERAFSKNPTLLPLPGDHFSGFTPSEIDGYFNDLVENLSTAKVKASPLLAAIRVNSSRANQLTPFKSGAFYGYKNKSGQIVIEPTFMQAEDFHEGLAAVLPAIYRTGANFEQEWGYIDSSGKCQVNPDISLLWLDDMSQSYFSNGLAMHRVGPRCGYMDRTGKLIIHPLFDQALPFSENLAAVEIGGKFGFIDKTGKFAIKPQYDLVGSFSNGRAPALVIDDILERKDGQIIAPDTVLSHCQYGYIDRSGAFTSAKKNKLPPKLALILGKQLIPTFNQDGKPVFKPDFDALSFLTAY